MDEFKTIDFKLTQSELVRAVRGRMSQTKVNLRLGHSFNRIYRWEAGVTPISWLDFVKLCKACKFNLGESLRKHFGFVENPSSYGKLIEVLFGGQIKSQIAKDLHVSNYVIRSWAKQKTCPSVETILRMIHLTMGIAEEFCLEFGPIDRFPSLLDSHMRQKKLKELIYQNPWIEPALVSLDLERYRRPKKPSSDYFQKAIGITKEQEKFMLRELSAVGAIEFREGKCHSLLKHLDTRGNLEGSRRIRAYWLQKFREFILNRPSMPRNSVSGYFTVAVSENAQEKIRQAYYVFANEVISLVKDDSFPREKVEIIYCQLFDLSENE